MTSSQRIIVNTLASYGRTVLAAGLALFSSRWILNALGQTDFGLFALVGSLIGFVTFLNGVLSGSAGRFFAYAIGRGKPDEVREWFNTALVIHTALPSLLVLAGWPVGDYCIREVFVIPAERIPACLCVFHLTLVSAFVGMIGVPFLAMFTAKQRIAETAFWGLLQSAFVFALAFFLTRTTGDSLLVYAVGMVAISVFFYLIQVARAAVIFPECRVDHRLFLNRDRARRLFHFAFWNLVGGLGGILRGQGTAILLNLFHGPAANAAYGISNQVSHQALNLTQSMTGAMYPEITATAGHGDISRLHSLTLRACKFGTILALLFTIPLLLEMPLILQLWLKAPPPHAPIFCQIVLVAFLIDKSTIGYMLSINADGRIAGYQASVGVILLLTFPLAYLLLILFHDPAAALVAFIITGTGCSAGRIYWGRRLLGLSVYSWISVVFGRALLIALPAACIAALPQFLMPAAAVRLAATFILAVSATATLTWAVGLTCAERAWLSHMFRSTVRRLSPVCSA